MTPTQIRATLKALLNDEGYSVDYDLTSTEGFVMALYRYIHSFGSLPDDCEMAIINWGVTYIADAPQKVAALSI